MSPLGEARVLSWMAVTHESVGNKTSSKLKLSVDALSLLTHFFGRVYGKQFHCLILFSKCRDPGERTQM